MCTSGITGNQNKIQTAFKAAFQKLAVLGQDTSQMVDCSELIPVPPQLKITAAHFPAGLSNADVEQAVSYLLSCCNSGRRLMNDVSSLAMRP